MIGRYPDDGLTACKLNQPPDDFINATKIGEDFFLILASFLAVVTRMRFVKDMP